LSSSLEAVFVYGYFGKECLGWLAKGSPIFVAIGAILVYLAGVR